MELGAFVFYVVAAATVAAALGVVVTRSVVYSALLLVLALSMTGLIYLLLLADFLAFIQILVYGGTVSVLLVFALMLTRPQETRQLNHREWPLAALGAVVLLAVLAYQALASNWTTFTSSSAGRTTSVAASAGAATRIGPAELGTALFTTWAVPFEIASLVLLVALLGALVVARAAEERRRFSTASSATELSHPGAA